MDINFAQQPEEALRYFQAKGLAAQYSHLDNTAADHTRDFMVAKMMDLDLLSDVKQAVDDALTHGIAFDDFKKHLTEVLQEKGWWGQQDMVDPLTGETRTVQLGSPRRLKTIFDVNLSTSYAAGAWAKIADNSSHSPYLMYNAIDDSRTRPLHRSWDNKILRWNDTWWNTHYPPNGWRCRCSVIQLNDADLKDMGRAPDSSPEVTTKKWLNPRTGSEENIPVGIDPGWAYNVGQNYLQQFAQQFAEKAAVAPADLGAAVFLQAGDEAFAALDQQFGNWVDETLARGQSARSFALAGVLAPTDVEFMAGLGIAPINAGIVVEDRLLVGAKADRHTAKGDALSSDDWKNLPAALAAPEVVLWDAYNKTMLYLFPASDRKGKLAVEVNRKEKKQGVVNLAKSGYKVKAQDVEAHIKNGDYTVVRGKLDK